MKILRHINQKYWKSYVDKTMELSVTSSKKENHVDAEIGKPFLIASFLNLLSRDVLMDRINGKFG